MYEFGRHQRLLEKSEFDAVFSYGKKIVTKYFLIYYKPNSLPEARLGFVVAKKKIRKAWQRNKLKRKLRESFRRSKLQTMDVVVLPRKVIADVNIIQQEEFLAIWECLCAK